MKKLLNLWVILMFFCLISLISKAQTIKPYGYSRTNIYSGDSLRRFGGNISPILLLESTKTQIFAHLSVDWDLNYVIEWYKIDNNGIPIKKEKDNFTFKNNTYINDLKFCINDSAYYYSNGWYNNHESWDATVILEKRDTNLNLIWKKEYPLGQDTSVVSSSLLNLDQNAILMCFTTKIREEDNPSIPKKVFISLWKTDYLGNIIWKKNIEESEWNNSRNIIQLMMLI